MQTTDKSVSVLLHLPIYSSKSVIEYWKLVIPFKAEKHSIGTDVVTETTYLLIITAPRSI